jgi:hypothetical protein
VETGNPSVCATVKCKVCKLAISLYGLYLSVIKCECVTQLRINPTIRSRIRLISDVYHPTRHNIIFQNGSQDSAVDTVTDCRLDGRWVEVRVSVESRFYSSLLFRLVLGPIQPLIQWAPGALTPDIKLPEFEADQLTPANADVKNTWIYTSTTPYVFMVWCLII